ncbi:hypothetical protein PG993_000135 [Apiospora rasikravindrae]|uniref:Uncharacterized protein n=1 Tax=Apiospora rasikravindrae TaxID=990691 RepID=A0ABR1U7P9_9PEZI
MLFALHHIGDENHVCVNIKTEYETSTEGLWAKAIIGVTKERKLETNKLLEEFDFSKVDDITTRVARFNRVYAFLYSLGILQDIKHVVYIVDEINKALMIDQPSLAHDRAKRKCLLGLLSIWQPAIGRDLDVFLRYYLSEHQTHPGDPIITLTLTDWKEHFLNPDYGLNAEKSVKDNWMEIHNLLLNTSLEAKANECGDLLRSVLDLPTGQDDAQVRGKATGILALTHVEKHQVIIPERLKGIGGCFWSTNLPYLWKDIIQQFFTPSMHELELVADPNNPPHDRWQLKGGVNEDNTQVHPAAWEQSSNRLGNILQLLLAIKRITNKDLILRLYRETETQNKVWCAQGSAMKSTIQGVASGLAQLRVYEYLHNV